MKFNIYIDFKKGCGGIKWEGMTKKRLFAVFAIVIAAAGKLLA